MTNAAGPPETTQQPSTYRFGNFLLNPRERVLLRDNVSMEVQPRTFDVLKTMVRSPDRLITKEHFREHVWQGAVVTDNALTRCIRQLRHLLSDSATKPRFIQTVPRQGYRFIAPVETKDIGGESTVSRKNVGILTPDHPQKSQPADTRRLLVHPFSVELPESDGAPFANELQEELIDQLAAVPQLSVLGRRSTAQLLRRDLPLAELAVQFEVSHTIEGSVRAKGHILRLRAECVRTLDGITEWTVRREIDLRELSQAPLQLASQILEKLTGATAQLASVSASNVQLNPRAYQAYLLARTEFSRTKFQEALEYSERSLAHHPDNPLAQTLLAQLFLTWASYGQVPEPDPLTRSRRHLQLAQATNFPPARKVEAQLALFLERDFAKAIDLLTAPGQEPKAFLGTLPPLLFYGERYQAAIEIQRKLTTNDPLNLGALVLFQRMLRFVGDDAEADRWHELCLDLADEHLMVLQDRFDIALFRDRFDEASRMLDMMCTQQGLQWWSNTVTRHWLGAKLADRQGDQAAAKDHADQLAKITTVQPTLKAEAYFNAGQLDGVYEWIDQGIRQFDPGIYQMIAPYSVRRLDDPHMPAFIADKRYAEVQKRLGLDPESLARVNWQALDAAIARA